MPDKWRSAREADGQFAVTLKRIGERLRFKHSGIVNAPLPERMRALLDELRRRRSARRNQG